MLGLGLGGDEVVEKQVGAERRGGEKGRGGEREADMRVGRDEGGEVEESEKEIISRTYQS